MNIIDIKHSIIIYKYVIINRTEKGLLDTEVEKNININKLQNLISENLSLKNQMKTYSEAEEKYRNELMKITIELNNNKEKMSILELNENDKVNKMKSLESDNSILKEKLQQLITQYISYLYLYNDVKIDIIKK